MAYIGKIPATGAFQKCDALSASATADYTLQVGSTNVVPESVNHMIVSLNGVIQQPTTAYTVSGSTLSFASALTSNDTIDFVMLLGNVLDIGTPSDATVTKAKLANEVDVFAGTSLSAADLGSGIHIKTADSSASAHANVDELVVEGSAASGINILSGTGSDGSIYFGDSGDNNIGMVRYEHSGNNLIFRTNTADALTIDSAGHVTKPLQSAVHAYSNGTQDDIATGIVTINLNAEVYDVNSDFNTTNYTFTAPVTGKYMMCADLDTSDIDTANQGVSLLVVASNRNYYFDEIDPRIEMSADGKHTWSGSSLVDMDASDTLIMKTRSTAHGAAQHNIVTGQTWMTVHLAC